MRRRDGQQGRVYRAENSWIWDHPSDMTFEEMRSWLHRVCLSPWHLKHFPGRTIPLVLPKRGDRSTWQHGTIKFGTAARHRRTVLHELGHHLAGTWRHDAYFTSVHLRLVCRWLGKEAWKELRQLYRDNRVHYRAPNGFRR